LENSPARWPSRRGDHSGVEARSLVAAHGGKRFAPAPPLSPPALGSPVGHLALTDRILLIAITEAVSIGAGARAAISKDAEAGKVTTDFCRKRKILTKP
jgi:hypothetical protein